jgi:hypothetical protein
VLIAGTLASHSIDGQRSRTEKEGKELVDWDGPDDPENPFNWSFGYKWTVTIAVCLM